MANERDIQRPRGAVRQEAKATAAAATAPRGAARHQVTLKAKSQSWWRHNLLTAKEALSRLLQTPLPTLMTLAVLAIALTLPGIMYLALKNINALSQQWQGGPRVSLYLQASLPDDEAQRFSQELLLRQDLQAVELISKAQGLYDFKKASGLGDIFDYIQGNPLPAVVVLQPVDQTAEAMTRLQEEFSALPEVAEVVLDIEWVKRLAAFVEVANRIVVVLGGLLALAVLLVVGNTIRLIIENRRDEILVAKLVGATDAWIRRPFLYTGFWFGVLGGLMAVLLIGFSLVLITEPVNQLIGLYQSGFVLQGLSPDEVVILLASGLLLGLMGARLAVGQHLQEIEPR
ncbi:permease-like cell division protein FtsX [Neptuniibacter sp. CAU 1671]|uniref:permease-like cell division protein FtsX n=1 Tax=Neptuniibacter sp. CAU 1671 TaxID=3032593 RepID=UPI0023DB5BF1|nr:permease-like cell division protein FtsX [Neptuniibacter sp. CAU 1671]MDF2182425.1 permease-like cell division protein FtsX [Neptuniibacter sp. CAU 1671]